MSLPLQVSLFSLGDKSVRLVCDDAEAELIELHVFGPKDRRLRYTFNSLDICQQFRAAFEAKLQREGYVRVPAAERRRRRA